MKVEELAIQLVEGVFIMGQFNNRFSVDGLEFANAVVSCSRSFEILDGDNAR